MKLDQAIKIKELAKDDPDSIDENDLQDADDLSIEALKRVQDMRISPCTTPDQILPGENPSEPKTLPTETLVKIRESPLGREPKG